MRQYRLAIHRRFLRPPLVVLQVLVPGRPMTNPQVPCGPYWRNVTDQDALDLANATLLAKLEKSTQP